MINFKLSAFADEYKTSFEEQLRGLCDFGIGYIELRHLDGKNVSLLTKDEAKEAKRALDQAGIKVSAIGSPIGKIKLDGDIKGHLETARRVFETANVMEAPFVRVFSFYAPDGKSIANMRDEVVERFSELVELARSFGVKLCHENEAKIYGDVPERCLDLIGEFGGEVGCVFDMGNFVLEGVDPLEAYELLKKHIAYFHIKDALFEGAIVPPGCGDAKIPEILSRHKNYAKDDFFTSLEPHLELFSGLGALVGRKFENPYKYKNTESAFEDAVSRFKEIIL